MELMETVSMMDSTDYQERFKAEFFQLRIRIDKLCTMLEKYKVGTLNFTPSCSYELLHEQLIYMRNYKAILVHRAKIEGVDLIEGVNLEEGE